MSPVRIAVVGLGRWGTNYLSSLTSLPGAELGCGCDTDPRKRSVAIDRGLLDVRSRIDDVVSDPTLDAVVIATPSETHAPLAELCLEAGKHVLVEKPLSSDPTVARQVVEVAKRKKRVLLVGHLTLHNAAFVHMAKLVVDGAIGRILRIRTERSSIAQPGRDEPVLSALAPHDLAMALCLLRMSVDTVPVHVVEGRETSSNEASMRLAFGSAGSVDLRWSRGAGPIRRHFAVGGSLGELVLDEHAGTVTSTRPNGQRVDAPDGPRPLSRQCQHLVDCIRGVATPMPGLDLVIETAQILASMRSVVRGAPAENQLTTEHPIHL